MQNQPTQAAALASGSDGRAARTTHWRGQLRDAALRNALRKRDSGVPTYSVPEAAALLSISQEYLYRLIQAGGFPAVRLRLGAKHGRYVVPAKAVERLLNDAASAYRCIESDEWTQRWQADIAGGAA